MEELCLDRETEVALKEDCSLEHDPSEHSLPPDTHYFEVVLDRPKKKTTTHTKGTDKDRNNQLPCRLICSLLCSAFIHTCYLKITRLFQYSKKPQFKVKDDQSYITLISVCYQYELSRT